MDELIDKIKQESILLEETDLPLDTLYSRLRSMAIRVYASENMIDDKMVVKFASGLIGYLNKVNNYNK